MIDVNALPTHRMEVHCQPSSPWREGISVYMTWILGDRRQLAKPIVFEDVANGLMLEPTTVLDMAAAQQLIDGLWQCGLRPSEGTGSAGALAATQKHLDDMRQITFGVINDLREVGMGLISSKLPMREKP